MSATVRQPALRHRVDEPVTQERRARPRRPPVRRPRGPTRSDARPAPPPPRAPSAIRTSTPSSHAAVHQHRDATVDGRHHARAAHPASRAPDPAGARRGSTRRSPSAPCSIAACGVVGAQDALHQDRHAGHLVADPREVVPGDVRVELLGRAARARPAARTRCACRDAADRASGTSTVQTTARYPAPRAHGGAARPSPRGRARDRAATTGCRRAAAMSSTCSSTVEETHIGDADRGRGARRGPLPRRGAPAVGTPTARPPPGTTTACRGSRCVGSGDPDPGASRGQTRLRAKAASLSASVRSAPAPPAT